MRLGKNQLDVLRGLGSPSMAMVVPNKEAKSLVKRGLLRTAESGGFACITPAGLRVLADALESGQIEGHLEWAAKEREKRAAKAA